MAFDAAFAVFKSFFYSRTGVQWDQRYDNVEPDSSACKFIFRKPEREGMPLGVLPWGWVPPSERKVLIDGGIISSGDDEGTCDGKETSQHDGSNRHRNHEQIGQVMGAGLVDDPILL